MVRNTCFPIAACDHEGKRDDDQLRYDCPSGVAEKYCPSGDDYCFLELEHEQYVGVRTKGTGAFWYCGSNCKYGMTTFWDWMGCAVGKAAERQQGRCSLFPYPI